LSLLTEAQNLWRAADAFVDTGRGVRIAGWACAGAGIAATAPIFGGTIHLNVLSETLDRLTWLPVEVEALISAGVPLAMGALLFGAPLLSLLGVDGKASRKQLAAFFALDAIFALAVSFMRMDVGVSLASVLSLAVVEFSVTALSGLTTGMMAARLRDTEVERNEKRVAVAAARAADRASRRSRRACKAAARALERLLKKVEKREDESRRRAEREALASKSYEAEYLATIAAMQATAVANDPEAATRKGGPSEDLRSH
jgi:hypothetical protein